MLLSILICTLDERIRHVPGMLLPETAGVEYVVSWQYTDPDVLATLPPVLRQRTDVTVCPLSGRGLSLNRNNALAHARGELCVIADDDVRYDADGLRTIRDTMASHPEVDIAQFRVRFYDGTWMKPYAAASYAFRPDDARCLYPSSVELVLRRRALRKGLRFNPLFGLGAPRLAAGEEEILLADAARLGLAIRYFPLCIARTAPGCTGSRFATDAGVQRAKGAVFYRRFGLWRAYARCLREALSWFVRRGVNPLPLWRNMAEGIRYIRTKDHEQQ